jgi:hypothetical protein
MVYYKTSLGGSLEINQNNQLVEVCSKLPVKRFDYQSDGSEFQIECEASAKVNTDELIKVFGEIKRYLPPVNVYDVRSDIIGYTPGAAGEITVHWMAFTRKGRAYLRAIAQAIAKIYYKRVDVDSRKIETPPLFLENKRNSE